MKLYHFTDRHHLHGVGRYGLTIGDVPTDIHQWKGRCGVWPTSDSTAHGHGLEGSDVDKSRYRLTVRIAEGDPALVKWTEWSAKNVTPATIRVPHATASSFDTWYVYFGIVGLTGIEECVDMQTGKVIKDWCDAPQSELVRPVPPERRDKWHKKLMKKLRLQEGAN